MKNCPEISTLISYALKPEGEKYEEIAAHVFDCPDCQKNMEIIHETMLADKWCNPRLSEQDQYLMAACRAQKFELRLDSIPSKNKKG